MKQRYAYGYVRVSTHMQDELSPDSQEQLIREYARKNQIVVLKFFFEIGVSGRSADKRPAFQEMIGLAKSREHPVDAILVWKYSRFARNQEESIVYKSLLKRQNQVDVISVSEPLIDGPFGSLIERIIEWMDEYYSIRLSGEVFRGMKENAGRGAFQARPPLGYRIIEHGKPPVIVPEEAKIVKLIFQKYTEEAVGFFDIARQLNALGLRTSQGKLFERRSVEYILQNPVYCGMVRWNRTCNATKEVKDESEWIVTDGSQEAIITKELFEKAQQRRRSSYRPSGSRPSSTYRHWLSGMLKCPDCGRTLTASTMHRKNGETYAYFSCCGYSKGKCSRPNGISSLVLEKEVLQALKEVLGSGKIEYQLREHRQEAIIDQRKLLLDQLEGLKSKDERIRASYREGIDTLEEYRENKQWIQKEREELQKKLKELEMKENKEPAGDTTARLLERVQSVCEILESDHCSNARKNDALRQIVEKIVYNRSKDTLKLYYFYCV